MKFINGKLVVVGFNSNKNNLTFFGDLKLFSLVIDNSIEKKESGKFILNLTYKMTINSTEDVLIDKFITEYNFEIEKDNQNVYDGRKVIYDHLQHGLILSLNKMANNDTSLATEVLPSTNLHGTTETIVNSLIQLAFYNE